MHLGEKRTCIFILRKPQNIVEKLKCELWLNYPEETEEYKSFNDFLLWL